MKTNGFEPMNIIAIAKRHLVERIMTRCARGRKDPREFRARLEAMEVYELEQFEAAVTR